MASQDRIFEVEIEELDLTQDSDVVYANITTLDDLTDAAFEQRVLLCQQPEDVAVLAAAHHCSKACHTCGAVCHLIVAYYLSLKQLKLL